AWLEQSTLHVVAFVRLEAAWKQAKRLKALSAGVAPGSVPSPEEWQLAPFFEKGASGYEVCVSEGPSPTAPVQNAGLLSGRLHFLQRWALAAGFLLVLGISLALYTRAFQATYRTPVGGIASVPMSDGSKVTLNTDSKIRLAVTETERRI